LLQSCFISYPLRVYTNNIKITEVEIKVHAEKNNFVSEKENRVMLHALLIYEYCTCKYG
jgi:hypothetical protein